MYTIFFLSICMYIYIYIYIYIGIFICICISRVHDSLNPIARQNRSKSKDFRTFVLAPNLNLLYQPFWGFWLFESSRHCLIRKVNSRKESWYQDYSESYPSALSHIGTLPVRRQTCPKVHQMFECKHTLVKSKNHGSNYSSRSVLRFQMKIGLLSRHIGRFCGDI